MVTALAVALAGASATFATPTAPPTITTDMLVEAADLSGLALSPDGKWLAYRVVRGSLDANSMLVDWYVVSTDGRGAAQHLAAGGEALFNHAGGIEDAVPGWTGDSRALIFRARRSGSVQLWIAPVGGTARPLTADAADVVDFKMRPGGRAVDYTVGATRDAIRAAARAIYDGGMLVDGTVDLAQPIAGGLVIDGERVMQRYTGDWFDRAPLLHDTPLITHTVMLPDVAEAPALATAMARRPTIRLVRTPSSTTVIVERPDGNAITCPEAACGRAPVSATWIPGSNALVTSSENSLVVDPVDGLGRTRLRMWTVGAKTGRLLVDQAGMLSGGPAPSVACPVTATTMYCVAEAAASPPRLVAIDLKSGRQRVLDDPNQALRARIRSPVRALDWSASGRKFHGELLLPQKASSPVPLVVSYYTSRGFLRGGFGEALPVQPLLQAGIAVLCIDKSRLPPPYDAERNYQIARDGIVTIVDRLAREKAIDRDRVGIWGFSFGSEVATRIVRKTTLVKAAALASLQVTEAYYWANAFPGRNMQRVQRDQFGVDWPDSAPATWLKIAPSHNTATLSVPVLLQLPEDEARWMGEFMASALRDGKPVEMHAFADEAHALMAPRHKRAALERNLDWFRFWLRGERDPALGKAGQYLRWDRLASMAGAAASPK